MPNAALRRLLLLVPLAAALLAFWGTQDGGFVFDDHASIRDNAAIRSGDFLGAAFGERHSPVANRPLPCLLLALDHRAAGLEPLRYRLVNLLLHLANVGLLFFVVRQALLASNLRGRFTPQRAGALALVVTTLWAVHPLGVDAVAYVTQRTTLLMSFFLLLALRCWQRAADAAHPQRWHWATAAALALGMACKEELVAAPLLLLLYDRAFEQPSWRALRGRMRCIGKLMLSWLVLLACVLLGPSNPTVGYATLPRASAFEWLLTQAQVLPHYVRLVLWPDALRGAYDWPIVRSAGEVVLPGLLVLLLLGGTVLAFRRWPWIGFCGSLFFLLLAPTSSVLPIVTEVVAERRMYLPMLAVLVPVVLAADATLRRLLTARPAQAAQLGLAVALAVTGSLVGLTQRRVAVYADEAAFWADACRKNALMNGSFQAGSILSNQGLMLRQQGKAEQAHALFLRAVACELPTPIVRLHHAVSLAELGRRQEALPLLRALAAEAPSLPDVAGNFAIFLLLDYDGDEPARQLGAADPRLREAEPMLRRALELDPGRAAFHNAFGMLLGFTGRVQEAEAALRRAVVLDPQRVEPYRNLARLFLAHDMALQARQSVLPLLQARPRDVAVRLQLAQAFAARDEDGAAALLQDALRLEPGNAAVEAELARLRRGR